MAKYLVTGIAGFIGSSIAHELVRRGEVVRGLDDFSTGKRENIEDIKDDLDFRHASLLDPAELASACEGIDYVIHQAALPSVPKSVTEPELTHAVNVNGTLNLLLAARNAGVKRVVYAASSSAYGESEVLPKREDMLPDRFLLMRCKSLRANTTCRHFPLYMVLRLSACVTSIFLVLGKTQILSILEY